MTAKNHAWLIWAIAGIFYLYEYIHRVIVSVMVPELTHAFNVNSTLLSSLSAAYFFAYAFAQIPVGLLVDRYGARRTLTVACLAITIGSLLFADTQSFLLANYCRILIGFGSAFAFVGCLKVAANCFPAHKFALIVGLTNLLGIIGAILGGHPMAYATELLGWRNVMYASAGAGGLICVLLWKLVRDTKIPRKNKTAALKTLWKILQDSQTWLIALFAGAMVAPIVAYVELWGVSYLMQVYGIARPHAAHIASLTFFGIAIGGPLIGWLSDLMRIRTVPMGLGLFGAALAFSGILCAAYLPLWIISCLHLVFGFCSSSMLLCFSLNFEATEPNIRATTVAFTNSIIMLAGALLQTWCGWLLDTTQANFYLSFSPLVGCYVLAAVCWKFMREPVCEFRYE